jgi:hypothetical protein
MIAGAQLMLDFGLVESLEDAIRTSSQRLAVCLRIVEADIHIVQQTVSKPRKCQQVDHLGARQLFYPRT